jgi:hypothetical protein
MSMTAVRPRQENEEAWVLIEPPASARPVVKLLPPPAELDDFDPELAPSRVLVRSSEDVEIV